MLPGDLVRELVTRHEEEIEALVARADEAEARADAAERAVREHPAFALLDPDEATRLVPEPPEPVDVDDGRPRTTVVERSPANRSGAVRSPSGATPTPGSSPAPAATSPDVPPGFVARITTSHWWWRIGIALVAIALLLLKFG